MKVFKSQHRESERNSTKKLHFKNTCQQVDWATKESTCLPDLSEDKDSVEQSNNEICPHQTQKIKVMKWII